MLSADCRLSLLARPSESAALPSTAAAEKGATNASAGRNATDADPSARAPHAAKFAIYLMHAGKYTRSRRDVETYSDKYRALKFRYYCCRQALM